MGLLDLFSRAPRKNPTHINDDNFVELVKKSKIPVIVDAWSPRCAPCKQLEPVMVSLATRYDGRVLICEMNTHGAPRAATELKIAATPTVVYFKNGKPVEKVVGFRGSLYHEEAIEELFGIPKKPAS